MYIKYILIKVDDLGQSCMFDNPIFAPLQNHFIYSMPLSNFPKVKYNLYSRVHPGLFFGSSRCVLIRYARPWMPPCRPYKTC